MSIAKSQWDQLSSKFDVHKSEEEIDPGAADNILIAWPPIVELIKRHFSTAQELRALDYGCGTGGFTLKLSSLGFNVLGADNSEGMLTIARQQALGNKVNFINTSEIPNIKFDLITGVMVFQFIENIEEILEDLVRHLNRNGLLIFAVFNPEFVTACLKANSLFLNFKDIEHPTKGLIAFNNGDVKIPTYIRNASEYDDMLSGLGLRKKLEVYPEFTQEFLEKYPTDGTVDKAEYLILGYSN